MTMQTIARPKNSQEISASTTSARNTTGFKSNAIGLYSATSDFYIKLGGSDVVCTVTAGGYDKFCAQGQHDIDTGGATHVAVILASGTDTIFINEWTNTAL